MAAFHRPARFRVPSAGRDLAGTGSSAALRRPRRSRQTCSAPSSDLLVCVGDEPAENLRRNSALRFDLAQPIRPMKKVLLTTAQIAVTIALLYFVFRDPAKRAQMATALRLANYWWIALGIVAYFGVEAAAGVRFGVLLRVQGIRLSNSRVGALFFIGMFYNQFMPGGTGG